MCLGMRLPSLVRVPFLDEGQVVVGVVGLEAESSLVEFEDDAA